MEAEVLLSLYLSHGSLQFITYIIRLTFIILSDQTVNGAASIRGAPGDKQRNHSVKKSKTDPLRANFLDAIKLDRYNANRAPLFNAFVARFRLDMFSFFKTDEKRKGRGNGEDGDDFRKQIVETDEQKAAREYYEKYLSSLERCCKYYFTIYFVIIANKCLNRNHNEMDTTHCWGWCYEYS